MDSENKPIIVVRKRPKSHGGHHGGAWKVAYADFVTAMMALFIVLWLMNASDQDKKAISGYFKDPNGSGKEAGSSKAGSGEDLSVTKADMDHLKQKIETAFRKLPEFRQALKDKVEMTVTSEGLRIEFLETDKGLFFESGNAIPTYACKELLAKLAEQTAPLSNQLLIEGHTDSRPFTSRADYSNWELSADRANAARRVVLASGINGSRISQVRGFADQRLRTPGDPGNAANRRISVVIQSSLPEKTLAEVPGKQAERDSQPQKIAAQKHGA